MFKREFCWPCLQIMICFGLDDFLYFTRAVPKSKTLSIYSLRRPETSRGSSSRSATFSSHSRSSLQGTMTMPSYMLPTRKLSKKQRQRPKRRLPCGCLVYSSHRNWTMMPSCRLREFVCAPTLSLLYHHYLVCFRDFLSAETAALIPGHLLSPRVWIVCFIRQHKWAFLKNTCIMTELD